MNDTYIVTTYVIIDVLLQVMPYQDDTRTSLSAAEILTVAVMPPSTFRTIMNAPCTG